MTAPLFVINTINQLITVISVNIVTHCMFPDVAALMEEPDQGLHCLQWRWVGGGLRINSKFWMWKKVGWLFWD